MATRIDYFLSPVSPWTYLGHERLVAITRHRGAEIAIKPIDRGVFGVPTYSHAGEPYWGQDRLDFLDRALAK